VHVSHEGEDPDHGILSSLAETSPDGGVLTLADGIDGHAADSKVTLSLCEPPCVVREVGKQEKTDDGNQEGDNTLEDEEPLPARDASNITKTVEDTSCDQTSEGSGEDVTSVKDSDAGSDLLTVVEHRQEVDSAGVVRSLSDAQEEASEQETLEVLGQGSQR
jgi:hypothetical protein